MTEINEANRIEVVSVKFRNRGKMYFFDPAGLALKEGQTVVVETSKGLELGDVVQSNHAVPEERVVQPLRAVVRVATEEDERTEELCRRREREAFIVCKKKIEEHGLEMKLVDVECSFEGNKILFFFSSEGRVDFRELVKDLAGVFRTRIELRQIGVRDEARMLGGLGICGRPFCCGTFMEEFQPVSTKMAKTQSMSLNPAKISGTCGRLMCCLRYEQPAYEALVKNVPKNGAFVETPDGYGNVTQVNILRQTVKVKLDGPGDDTIRQYEAEEVAAIPGGRPRDGSQPPHVLVLKPKTPKEEEEPAFQEGQMPELIVSASEEMKAESGHGHSRRREVRRESLPREKNTESSAKAPRQKNRGAKQNASAPKSEQPVAEKQTEEKHHAPKNRSRGHKGGKHRPAVEKSESAAAQNAQKHQQKPQSAAQPTGEKKEGGENRPKKNNHRRYYKPKPRQDGEGNKPKQEG